MFSKIFKTLTAIAAPVVGAVIEPRTLINLAAGAVLKHVVPGDKINQAIPYLNMGATVAILYGQRVASTHDWTGSVVPALTESGVLAGASTLMHQWMKIPLRGVVTGDLARRVGPGVKFSI